MLMFLIMISFAFGQIVSEAETLSPNPMRTATMSWGGFNGNDQLVGSAEQWPFVAKHMDAFLMHGAYWLSATNNQHERNLAALGEILQKNGKKADVETGFGETPNYDPNVPAKRQAYARAHHDIDFFTAFAKKGVLVNKFRVDWMPGWAMAAYAEKYQTTNSVQLFKMLTGAEEFPASLPEGFDLSHANWVEYGVLLKQAFPEIKIVFDQAPCNHRPVYDPDMRQAVSWPGFGYGYNRDLKKADGKPAMVGGKPVKMPMDFGDLLNGVILGSRKYGINFYGFEGDTPYEYLSNASKDFPKEKLTAYLLAIEHFLHSQGFHDARFLNDAGRLYGEGDSKSWVRIDMGAAKLVNRVNVVWGRNFGSSASLETSLDNNVWQLVSNLKDGDGKPFDSKFKPREARYVRLNLKKCGTSHGYQIEEIEVYGPEKPTNNLALGKWATASSISTNHPSEGQKARKGIAELVDGKLQTCWENNYINTDVWDMRYHDRSLEYLEYWQSVGGRPDQYVVESWYDGPFTLFPETKPGTFSNLARDVIRRLKGIDDDGSLMKVSFSVRGNGAGVFDSVSKIISYTLKPGESREFEVQVRNDARALNQGDARCTPLLRVDQNIPAGLKVDFATIDKKDITDEVLARGDFDGHFLGGLEPGETKTILVRFTLAAGAAAVGDVKLKLFWNPQDPQSVVRDSLDFIIK